MRLYRSGLAGAREVYSRGCSDRLDEPNQAIPRHGCISAEPAAVSSGKIIVPRIVIGRVIVDQPAGGGIGAAKSGAPSWRTRVKKSLPHNASHFGSTTFPTASLRNR